MLWTWGFLRLGLLSCAVGLFVASVGDAGMELATSGAQNRMAVAATALVLLVLPLAVALGYRRGLNRPRATSTAPSAAG